MREQSTLAQQLVDQCLARGASAAEVTLSRGYENEIEVRDGKVDRLSSGQPSSVSVRVWRGERVASTQGTRLDEDTLQTLIRDAIELADLSDPIPGMTLAPKDRLATTFPDLDLYDPQHLERTTEEKIERAIACEHAALHADPRISVSNGASYSDAIHTVVHATSHGFVGAQRSGWTGMSAQAIANDTDDKKRNGGWYSVARYADDLLSPQTIGQYAAQRAVEQLGAGPIPTTTLPVVLDPYMAASVIGGIFGALTGSAIERGSSFLIDKEHTQIAAPILTLIDDPTRARGLGSRAFDSEGLPAQRTTFIKDGVLQTYAINTYNAHKLGRTPTGHARGNGEGPSNLYVQPGTQSPEEIIASIDYGFYCQSMMGFGVNLTTGDFSRGASGFLIENGKLTRPVSEITLSGNYRDMLQQIDAIGNDLTWDRAIVSPTVLLRKMTLGGT